MTTKNNKGNISFKLRTSLFSRKKYCVYITEYEHRLAIRLFDGNPFNCNRKLYPMGILCFYNFVLYQELFSSKEMAILFQERLQNLPLAALEQFIREQNPERRYLSK
jgi:hypothetical protein